MSVGQGANAFRWFSSKKTLIPRTFDAEPLVQLIKQSIAETFNQSKCEFMAQRFALQEPRFYLVGWVENAYGEIKVIVASVIHLARRSRDSSAP